jgi:hypothetical protein
MPKKLFDHPNIVLVLQGRSIVCETAISSLFANPLFLTFGAFDWMTRQRRFDTLAECAMGSLRVLVRTHSTTAPLVEMISR